MDVGRSANFFKNLDPEQDYFRVRLSANSDTNFSDEVLVRFSSLIDTAYNGSYQAWGIQDHSTLADIAVLKPDGLISIALWNSDSLIWIPLKVDAKSGEDLKLSFDLEHLESRATIYLHDLLLDRVMEVGYGFEYNFKQDSLLVDNRFYLSESSKSLGENGLESTDVFWFSDENGVHLDFRKLLLGEVNQLKIYDSAGQLVFSKNGLQQKEILVLANEPSGIYFVHYQGSGFQQVIKVMRK